MLASTPKDCKCNYRVKSSCPINGKFQGNSIVYKAVVTSEQEKKEYIGLTEHAFKHQYSSHQTSFRHQKYEQSTEVTKHIWSLKRKNETYNIEWVIYETAPVCTNKTKKCQLCATEKLKIITADRKITLNRRSELVSKRRRQNKFTSNVFLPSITKNLSPRRNP